MSPSFGIQRISLDRLACCEDTAGQRRLHWIFRDCYRDPVASRGRWGVPSANRFFIGFAKNSRDGFAAGLQLIGKELGCSTRLL
jgi:hypothetical protein